MPEIIAAHPKMCSMAFHSNPNPFPAPSFRSRARQRVSQPWHAGAIPRPLLRLRSSRSVGALVCPGPMIEREDDVPGRGGAAAGRAAVDGSRRLHRPRLTRARHDAAVQRLSVQAPRAEQQVADGGRALVAALTADGEAPASVQRGSAWQGPARDRCAPSGARRSWPRPRPD